MRATNDVLGLSWYAPECVPRLRGRPAWRKLLDDLTFDRADDSAEADDDDDEAKAAEDELDVFGLLTHADPVTAEGLPHEIAAAVRADGRFVAPIVVAPGELVLPFDELEVLRATVAACTPAALGDPAAQMQLDAAARVLATPGIASTSGVDFVTGRLREAVANKRGGASVHVDTIIDRTLVDGRKFQKRAVFGAPHVRGLLQIGEGDVVPVYLPEKAAAAIPLFQRLRVRLLAEVHPRIDPTEAHAVALRAVAVARHVPIIAARAPLRPDAAAALRR